GAGRHRALQSRQRAVARSADDPRRPARGAPRTVYGHDGGHSPQPARHGRLPPADAGGPAEKGRDHRRDAEARDDPQRHASRPAPMATRLTSKTVASETSPQESGEARARTAAKPPLDRQSPRSNGGRSARIIAGGCRGERRRSP